MTESSMFDRSRRAEDEYFRRRDAELVAKARAALRLGPVDEPAIDAELRELAEAIGLGQADLVVPLHTAGLRAENVALLEWLPAVEVAWIDDVDRREREALRTRFGEVADQGTNGTALLTEWLFVRPPHEAMIAARRVLRHQLESLDAGPRRDMLRRIVSRCQAVGRASGGLFGLGAISGDELDRINEIRDELGGHSTTEYPLPAEIPH
jgi:hypothetical protein